MSYTQRSADWVIRKAYLHGRHKLPPAQTDAKYALLLDLVDSSQSDWATEAGTEWDSLYQRVDNGAVTATDTYDIEDDIQYISKREGDYVTLLDANGNTTIVPLVKPDQLYTARYMLACSQVGRTLVFSKLFAADSPYIGQTIEVPAVIYTDDVTSARSLIQCNDPLYLAYMVAAEDIREDVVLGDQYNNLLDKAAEHMDKMKQANTGQNEEIARVAVVEGWNY